MRITFLLASVVLFSQPSRAQDDDDEPPLLPGLIAQYDGGGAVCARRDEAVQFVWGEEAPDERLPPGAFSAQWQGQLLVLSPGKHRFYLYAAGHVALDVAGANLIQGESVTPRWFESPPIELEFGHQPLTVRFSKTSDNARVGLYWSGPQFELEPVPARLLFHEPANDPGDAFERGAELWRALRCDNCHRPTHDSGLRGPSLARLAGNISRDWMIDWLLSPTLGRGEGTVLPLPPGEGRGEGTPKAKSPSIEGVQANSSANRPHPNPGYPLAGAEGEGTRRRMPQFNLAAQEAAAIADYLREQAPEIKTRHASAGDARRGQRLFFTLGCLACHQVGELGNAGLFGGGDLSHIAEKRPADFFGRWLRDPATINADHRMPVFRLSEAECDDLAAWLTTLRRSPPAQAKPLAKNDAALGKRLVEALRCGNCHALPGQAEVGTRASERMAIPLGKPKHAWQETCLGAADRKKSRPGYDLPPAEREALLAYLPGLRTPASPRSGDGRFVLRERNCLACHARDGGEGIAPVLSALVASGTGDNAYATMLPLLAPPALTGIGDKLHDTALADAITLRNPPLRPWLAIRMPRFNLSDPELASLTDYFTAIDRIPDRPRAEPKLEAKAAMHAGGRLVTATGFGCTSCHQIGHALPTNVALAAHGTDLSLLGRRIRRPWFDRWVRNPARIVPRMEMPAIQIPVRGVLGDKIDNQLAAVWQVLNTAGFEPPPSGPIRVARHSGDGPPVVITDVVNLANRVIVRPVLIGLSNRHNVLFDIGGNRLAGWWLGDTAQQLTQGKGWHWEPAAANLPESKTQSEPEVELVAGERTLSPVAMAGSSLSEVDWYETLEDSIKFGYRLTFADGEKSIEVQVTQRISPLAEVERHYAKPVSGFQRQWQFTGVPAGYTLRWNLGPGGQSGMVGPIEPCADGQGTGQCYEARYTTLESVAAAAPATAQPPAESATHLPVVPGYEAVRLPLPRSEMPTGLAWRDDGTLVFCSLKGGVWLARDTDDDGLEDRLSLVADGLPAPYGIACDGETIDVAAKYGLVRLSQLDGEGRARRADVVASGWGYTVDYHDWTIGLPRDATGNYYIGLPCQQDNRSPADAALRGTVIKLLPRAPSSDSPRRFDLDVLSAGLRFPTGLALDRDGELFVTDNQGNYNPFNELNHIHRGARYGFINKLEARPGFQPPFDEPAIALPHPWTRSVNGICFLYAPDGSPRDLFGPFEGHLLGCEFDTRRLVRMSLEKIGDVYQGAAYPFSIEPSPGEPTFEGPIVCTVSPRGDIYVGNLRDSGWGGGQNTGSIVRLRANTAVPTGIAEVRARADGFTIDFTGPVDRKRASDAANYAIVSYRRIATPAYGGPDVDRESETISGIEMSSDRRAIVHMKRMRPGFVYEIQLKKLTADRQQFFPAEAHYTLRRIPVDSGDKSPQSKGLR